MATTVTHPANNDPVPSNGHSSQASKLAQTGLLLLVPLAAGCLAWKGKSHYPEATGPDDKDVRTVLERPFVVADVQALPSIEPSLGSLQSIHYQQEAELAQASPGEMLLTDSPLFWWARIERTARRHKSTLDYFLGFGY